MFHLSSTSWSGDTRPACHQKTHWLWGLYTDLHQWRISSSEYDIKLLETV